MEELSLEKKIEYTKECIRRIEQTKYPVRGFDPRGICDFVSDISLQKPHWRHSRFNIRAWFPELKDMLDNLPTIDDMGYKWTNTPQGKAARLRFLRKLLVELMRK